MEKYGRYPYDRYGIYSYSWPGVCPACGHTLYEINQFPVNPDIKNAAQLNWLMNTAQKAFWPTQLDRMRGMDDDELIACIKKLAEEEYVRGFCRVPTMIGHLPERLKERIEVEE